ncbi:hypothetical protein Acr_07g0012020 [Actinidia rufa]|uniref:Uncharacterized protein n=1 Tax=Actinidia rufa TaxID=165716 RepID=A0A7J0EXT6_9ERIC|nr:hypothetical protein Acr_07g0012020 [Actinidia rufa]
MGELLYVYLVILEHAVSLVLLREVDGKQRLIYFVKFLSRIVCPELGCPASAHSKEGSSAGTSASTVPAFDGLEVRKEPPQGAEESTTHNITESPEVHKEPPQIDHSKA